MVHRRVAQFRADAELKVEQGVVHGLKRRPEEMFPPLYWRQTYDQYCNVLEAKPVPISTEFALAMTCKQLRHETEYLVYAENALEITRETNIKALTRRFPRLVISLTDVYISYISMLCVEIAEGERCSPKHERERVAFFEALKELKALKKITLLDHYHHEAAHQRLVGPCVPRDYYDPRALEGLRLCIEEERKVEVEIDRKNLVVEKFSIGSIVGKGIDGRTSISHWGAAGRLQVYRAHDY